MVAAVSLQGRKPYVILAICWTILTIIFSARMVLSIGLPLIEQEFKMSHAFAGLIFSTFIFGYGISQLISGVLCDSLGPKKTIIISLGLSSAFSLLAGMSISVIDLSVSMVALGSVLGLYASAGISLISRSFSEEKWGRALGIHESGAFIGQALGVLIAGNLAATFGWRSPFLLWTVPLAAVGIVFWKIVTAPKISKSVDVESSDLHFTDLIKTNRIYPLLIGHMLISSFPAVGPFVMIPLYLASDLGLDVAFIGLVFGFSRFAGIFGAIIGGALSDKVGHKRVLSLATVGLGGSLVGFALTRMTELLLLLLVSAAFFVSIYYPSMWSMIGSCFPISIRGRGLGYLNMMAQFAICLSPPTLGAIADLFGFTWVWITSTIVGLIGLLFILSFKQFTYFQTKK